MYKKWVSSGHLTDPSRAMTKSGNNLEAEGIWAVSGHQPSHFLLPQIHFSPLPFLSSFWHVCLYVCVMGTHMHACTHAYVQTHMPGPLYSLQVTYKLERVPTGTLGEGSPMAGVDHLSNTCPSPRST